MPCACVSAFVRVNEQSAELREKVLVGQQCLERALQDALSAREEIARRKHHGQILLARIRYLKVIQGVVRGARCWFGRVRTPGAEGM